MLEGLHQVTYCKSQIKNFFFISESPTGLRGSHMAPYTNSENYSVMKSDGAFVPYHTRHIKAHPLVMPVISFQIRGKVANSRELLSHIRKKTHCAQGHKKKKKKKRGKQENEWKTIGCYCSLFYSIRRKALLEPYSVLFT